MSTVPTYRYGRYLPTSYWVKQIIITLDYRNYVMSAVQRVSTVGTEHATRNSMNFLKIEMVTGTGIVYPTSSKETRQVFWFQNKILYRYRTTYICIP